MRALTQRDALLIELRHELRAEAACQQPRPDQQDEGHGQDRPGPRAGPPEHRR